ncbi:MAG TPA: tetratricopeptide repeat protein [Gaiellaceae bacterium]|nr:tetratricopeptide repeat protein [Gaiellaceae bacterium]
MGVSQDGSGADVAGSTVVPYLPRVTLEWLRDAPDERHRALAGTMAFVDVSGFTAMSERLAPKGRLGAEEVTDVMSATFGRLLGVAYELGGGLVKLGGDALLLFFDGDGHAARACAAAWGMRDSLAALGPLQTSVGPVELKMHVGIHSGDFDFFLVGSRHRELIVAGPEAATTVEMEDTAEAGEIAVSDATAAHLGETSLGERKGAGTLLSQPPAVAFTGIGDVPDIAEADVLACIPEALRVHLVAERVESEHRQAAVAFVRFGGAEEGLDTESVAEVVDALQDAAAAHGVCFLESDIDAVGGRVILVAGVPTTAGGDEERLLRTVRAAVDEGTRLPLHVGVAAGNVFAGRIGPPYRQAFTILGGTAALAARLMAKADARSIWTTPDLLERSRTLFATQPVGALVLKGKAEPVDAVAVGEVTGARESKSPQKLPLVDRQRELPVLDAALVPVRMGFGSFVELVGDAGIGKSRIVEELCDRAEGLTLVSAACEQYEATTPYHPFRNLLRGLLDVAVDGDSDANSVALSGKLGEIDPELVPWTPLVADVIDAPVHSTQAADDLQPAFRRARLHGVVETVLGELLEPPTLLLFEDVHWMDEASSDLLRHLGSRVSARPWLVCATRRPAGGGFVAAEGNPPVPAMSLRLDPLPEADAHELAVAAAAEDLPPDELAAITERAGGNPLFVQELVAATRVSEQGLEALPESVEGVVTSRIDNLAPADRALLRWAAVLGASFSGELVARVLQDDPEAALDSESWDRLAEFVERDPYAAGTFHFRHALIRDAAYEGLSFRRRRELHARVAEVVGETAADEEEVAETLSLHYSLAERPAETWRFSLLAAERARAKFANADAAELYRRALAAAPAVESLEPAAVGRTWEALADVLELSGDYGGARLAYRQARARLRSDADALAGLCLKEGRLRENEGHYTEALRWYERGLRRADELDGALQVLHRLRLSLGYAAARFRQGAFEECVEWVERVIEEARAAGALEELAHAYYLVHLAYTSLGSPRRHEVRELALPIYEELGDLLGQANALNNLGIDAYYEGRWEEALGYYDRSRAARERIGDVVGAATIANNIAEILSDQGRIDEAEAELREVRAICEAAGSRLMTAVADANLGRAAARAGRTDEARELLSAAASALREIDAGSFVVEVHARLAEAALFGGDADLALATVAETGAITGTSAPPAVEALLRRVRGQALRLVGDPDEAWRELEESLRVAREGGMLYEEALTLEARARLTGAEEDAAEARRILAALDVVRVPEVP